MPPSRHLHVAIDARLLDYTSGGIAEYTFQLARALTRLGSGDRFTLLRAARPGLAGPTVEGVAERRWQSRRCLE